MYYMFNTANYPVNHENNHSLLSTGTSTHHNVIYYFNTVPFYIIPTCNVY